MVERRLRWLEISADFQCNNRCVGCYSVSDEGAQRMSSRDVVTELFAGRERGATSLWLGGGEPTLRKDLIGIVRKARELGYERIKLQTNGMLLSYPEFTDKIVDAGVTEVNFAIKGASAASHDRLTRTPGCHELMCKGIAEARRRGLRMEGDLLVYRSNQNELAEMVQSYFELGLARFNVWLFSATDQGDKDLSAQVPRLSEVVPEIVRAMDLRLSSEPEFITSLHTPPCVVPSRHHACLFDAKALSLWVANPGGYGFFLEESPIEGGHYLERCQSCRSRVGCGGIRADYLAIFGDSEFQPL
ncbi:MAG TPA: radical SAM protein [Polyangiaceae bacterium]|nr:radical SAM protein [Polyangiaceae bacterium]HMR77251.1 radical SAM protein [Polyangiaceae bacterium]